MTKIFKCDVGYIVMRENKYFLLTYSLSELLGKTLAEAKNIITTANNEINFSEFKFFAPIDQHHEIWACGVTYLRSKVGRMEESDIPDLYSRVYEADRPEIFYKTVGWRAVADGAPIGIRADSGWDVPEAEIVLVVNSAAEIFGYTVGNDVSSRSIEGENTLYLPQAKSYEKSCSIGNYIVPSWEVEDPTFPISLEVERDTEIVFQGETSSALMKRTFPDLVSWFFRTLPMPHGAFLFTGTGIVPDASFTLQQGDQVKIDAGILGRLDNPVVLLG
jgi:2-dehydro-3-deoxy-D-arabinonate dehydratase